MSLYTQRKNLSGCDPLRAKEMFIKFIFLFCLLSFTHQFCKATRVAGYIVTETSDTLHGEIRISNFDKITGAWIFNGFDQQSLHYGVFFKENGYSHFQSYTPKDIRAFGFNYQSTDYIFRSFVLVTKDLFNKEQKRYRFLSLEYNGRISLLCDLVYTINRMNYTSQRDYYITYEYYLFSESKGLKKLELTKNTKSLSDLLLFYSIEKDYLELLPVKARLKDIKTILAAYDNWCNRRLTMETKSVSNTITAFMQ